MRYEDVMYTCQSVGCWSGDEFESLEPAYWEDRGYSPPRHCPTCRKWCQEQENEDDVYIRCGVCDRVATFPAKFRISYHKKEGAWHDFLGEMKGDGGCGRCLKADDPGIAGRHLRDMAVKKYGERIRGLKSSKSVLEKRRARASQKEWAFGARSFSVSSSPELYANVKTKPRKLADNGPTGLSHVLQPRHRLCVALGTDDASTVLHAGAHIASRTGENVLQFSSGQEIVKVDLEQGIVVILTQRHTPGNWLIETMYSPEDVVREINRGVSNNGWKQGAK